MTWSRWNSVAGVTLAQTLALVPPAVVLALDQTASYLPQLATALIAALGLEVLFALLRSRRPNLHGITTALIVATMAPPDLALWQLGLVVSLGTLLAELVFGGRGFGFVAPAIVALALLTISFPQAELSHPSQRLALATLPGAALLLAFGLISWRILLSCPLLIASFLLLSGESLDVVALATGLTFGVVFLICDPTNAATTNPGRWVYGVLAGALIIVLSSGTTPTPEALVFAALLASIFAPLIDHLVVLAHARRRQTRARRWQRLGGQHG